MSVEREKIEELTKTLFRDWKIDAEKLSAEDTKAKYVEPMLGYLGWDPVDNMIREDGKKDSSGGL